MRIVVVGASGYIGKEVAQALRRRGHEVVGVVSNASHVKSLAADEIRAVVGGDGILSQVVTAETSVVVDCLPPAFEANRKVLEAAKAVNARYVYTSGVLIYGECGTAQVVDERRPVRSDRKWPRAEHEQAALAAGGTVLRPGWVYGKSFGKYASGWFESKDNNIVVEGNPDREYGWIHVVDLADAYVRVVEAPAAIVAGEVFNVNDDTRLTYQQIRVLMASTALNGAPVTVTNVPAGDDDWSVFSNVSARVSSRKLQRVLGWFPRHGPFSDAVSIGYEAAQAHRQ